MTISLNPRHEKLAREKVQNGEFASIEAVVGFALNRLLGDSRESILTPEERLRALDIFLAEVDGDPPSEAGPLSEGALARRNLYDNDRNRL